MFHEASLQLELSVLVRLRDLFQGHVGTHTHFELLPLLHALGIMTLLSVSQVLTIMVLRNRSCQLKSESVRNEIKSGKYDLPDFRLDLL